MLFSETNPITNPEVSFRSRESAIVVGTFDSASTLLADALAVSRVLFGKAEKSLNGLLICIRVSTAGHNKIQY